MSIFMARARGEPMQWGLFDGVPDAWSRIGVPEHEAFGCFSMGFLSFNPRGVGTLERWMRTELSLNTVRRMLAELERPFAYRHGEMFFDFAEHRWRRRFDPAELFTMFAASPERAGEAVTQFIEALARFGHREELERIQAFLRIVLERREAGS